MMCWVDQAIGPATWRSDGRRGVNDSSSLCLSLRPARTYPPTSHPDPPRKFWWGPPLPLGGRPHFPWATTKGLVHQNSRPRGSAICWSTCWSTADQLIFGSAPGKPISTTNGLFVAPKPPGPLAGALASRAILRLAPLCGFRHTHRHDQAGSC